VSKMAGTRGAFEPKTLGDAAVAPQFLPHIECVGSEVESLGIDFENPTRTPSSSGGREPQPRTGTYQSETTDNRL
jgi:hypothetical protein